MIVTTDHFDLIKKAQLGDRECLDRLGEVARDPLHKYVQRLTLREDLTQDIVQESILEMYKVFNKLKQVDRFWSWLYGIAFNKVRSHYGKQWRQKTVPLPEGPHEIAETNCSDGLAEMITAEWKQIVVKSMRELQPRHRAVITMRCYDQMAYAEIAKWMECSEFSARALFYRAKKALAKKLSIYGLGKGSLLAALILFGKLTAPSKAAAAEICVTASTLKVGMAATAAAIITGKAAIVTLTTVGVLAAGTAAIVPAWDKLNWGAPVKENQKFLDVQHYANPETGNQEYWYYYPPRTNDVVMTRILKWDGQSEKANDIWIQNDRMNYYYDQSRNIIYLNNHRTWQSDFSVQRLPTDSGELRDFISQVEGKPGGTKYVPNRGNGLLVKARYNEGAENEVSPPTYLYNAMYERYFQSDLPAGTQVQDQRDAMHKQGWTYFRIAGQINGKQVAGKGRIPFVYATSQTHRPWLELTAGQRMISESSFTGLSRPWMGLHTIDTVRRDAAKQGIWFETGVLPDGSKAEVTLTYNKNKLVYTIDMQADVVEKITFVSETGKLIGQLNFSYLQEVENIGNEFTSPRKKDSAKPQGKLWLCELINLK